MDWATARKAALLRDGGRCRRCLREATEVHHRLPKGMGGTSDPERAYGLSGLISACSSCHRWIHAHPALAYEQGWLVHWWRDPRNVPLRQEAKYEF